jgi:hypothetical protein
MISNGLWQSRYIVTVTRELRLREIQLPEKYKLNFKVSSEGPFARKLLKKHQTSACIFRVVVSLSILRFFVLR